MTSDSPSLDDKGAEDDISLYVLDVTHSFDSLRLIEKYVIVVVSICFSLMSLDLSLVLFFL